MSPNDPKRSAAGGVGPLREKDCRYSSLSLGQGMGDHSGSASGEPLPDEAVQDQRDRHCVERHQSQRIRGDQPVGRVESEHLCGTRRGQEPGGDRDHEIGDSERVPPRDIALLVRPARYRVADDWCCQTSGDIAETGGQRERARQMAAGPQDEEDSPEDSIGLDRD